MKNNEKCTVHSFEELLCVLFFEWAQKVNRDSQTLQVCFLVGYQKQNKALTGHFGQFSETNNPQHHL